MLQDAAHLRDLLAVTARPDVEEALLKILGAGGLQRLILTAEQLAEVLEWVYPVPCTGFMMNATRWRSIYLG